MCLESIDFELVNLKTYQDHRGWKIFRERDDKQLMPLIYSLDNKQSPEGFIPEGIWLRSTADVGHARLQLSEEKSIILPYPTGFHIYLKKPRKSTVKSWSDERHLTVREVLFSGPYITGKQDNEPVVVARRMCVLRCRSPKPKSSPRRKRGKSTRKR